MRKSLRANAAFGTNTSKPGNSTIRITSRTIPIAAFIARTSCLLVSKPWRAIAGSSISCTASTWTIWATTGPGQRAAQLHQVNAPLVDAELTKAEIRELSRLAGLSTWDRPASACLSSRIPYGTPVTSENVKTVERGEEAIRALGFRQFRVRFHGELVRIEIAPDELEKALNPRMAQTFVEIFKPFGFHYVTIDLEGYRQGSLNSVLGSGSNLNCEARCSRCGPQAVLRSIRRRPPRRCSAKRSEDYREPRRSVFP